MKAKKTRGSINVHEKTVNKKGSITRVIVAAAPICGLNGSPFLLTGSFSSPLSPKNSHVIVEAFTVIFQIMYLRVLL